MLCTHERGYEGTDLAGISGYRSNAWLQLSVIKEMRYEGLKIKILYLPTTEAPLSAKASAYSLPSPAERKTHE